MKTNKKFFLQFFNRHKREKGKMRINNQQPIKSQPAFGAIKIVENISSKEFYNITKKYSDTFELGYNTLFKAKSPLHAEVEDFIVKNAPIYGGSPEWLRLNAKYHGINIEDPNKAPLFDFSDEDALKLAFFKLKTAFKAICFDASKINSAEWLALPEHLRQLMLLNDFADKYYPKFKKFLDKRIVLRMSADQYIESLEQNKNYRK